MDNNYQQNNLWIDRIPQVATLVSLLVLLFYLLTSVLELSNLDAALKIGLVPAIFAAITLLVSGVFLIKNLPQKVERLLPLVTQILLISTAAVAIYSTGGAHSYLLPLWLAAVAFVGLFGPIALVLAAILPVAYAIWATVDGSITLTMIVVILMAGGIPVYLSYLIFSRLTNTKESSRYGQLASQFSQVSDKSEVVINAITNSVLALNNQGNIELINPAAQRLIGWSSQDALKLDYKSVLKLIDVESKELTPANDPIEKALTTNQEVRTEDLTLVTNSGKKILISLVASPVGQPGSGVIVVFRDITKERAEEREQTEFISTASHEMRTPVASIEGYLGLALNPATAQIDDKARSYISKAQEVAQHLGRLFQDLLDITKAEDGRLTNNPRAIEVVNFVQGVVEDLRTQAEAKGLVLLYKPLPEGSEDEKTNRRLNPVFYANVDNDHFREVISNLVENAIKYTKQGTISVDVGGDDSHVEISVEDTGIGIPSEDLSHLFQKFYRVDNSDTREIGGTGLGLYLSRRLVEAMDGRIWAESQYGQGSTFFVSIPRISHEEAMQLIETLDDESATEIGAAVPQGQMIQPAEAAATFEAPEIVEPIPQAPQTVEPAPEVQPSVAPSEGVFANPPAVDIAAQLTAMPQPAVPATEYPDPAIASEATPQPTYDNQYQQTQTQSEPLVQTQTYVHEVAQNPVQQPAQSYPQVPTEQITPVYTEPPQIVQPQPQNQAEPPQNQN